MRNLPVADLVAEHKLHFVDVAAAAADNPVVAAELVVVAAVLTAGFDLAAQKPYPQLHRPHPTF